MSRFDDSLAGYRAALADRPDAIDVRAEYGAVLLSTGDVPGAIEQYELIRRARPESAEAAWKLGQLYEMGNRPEDAVRCYRSAIEHGTEQLRNLATVALDRLRTSGS